MARRLKLADQTIGDRQHISCAQAWASARCIALARINRGLSAGKPIAILSENDLDHALLALGCMVAGVPFVPVSPRYSLLSQDFDKLRHVLKATTPALVFAADGALYAKVIHAAVAMVIEVVLGTGRLDGRGTTAFSDLLAPPPRFACCWSTPF